MERREACATCGASLSRWEFSSAQWRKGPRRKCNPCVERIAAGGSSGTAVAAHEHAMSDGLVDGRSHRAPGRKVGDRARRCSKAEMEVARAQADAFVVRFDLRRATVADILAEATDVESQAAYARMTVVLPAAERLPSECECDFLTTVREPVVHLFPSPHAPPPARTTFVQWVSSQTPH